MVNDNNIEDDESLLQEAIKFWRGKPNNPLNGMTFSEIYKAVREHGITLTTSKLRRKYK